MKTVHVQPAPGRAVPHPEKGRGALLPDGGAVVPLNAYWRRRLNDADVIEVADEVATEEPAAEPVAEAAPVAAKTSRARGSNAK